VSEQGLASHPTHKSSQQRTTTTRSLWSLEWLVLLRGETGTKILHFPTKKSVHCELEIVQWNFPEKCGRISGPIYSRGFR